MVDGAIPGLAVPAGKQSGQAMESKPVSSTTLWPLHQALPLGSYCV